MIVGTGELGPGGTGRSRFALELDARRLAGRRRRARLAARPRRRTSASATAAAGSTRRRGEEVPEARLARALRGRRRRSGSACARSRTTGRSTPPGSTVLAPVTLERDLTLRGRDRGGGARVRATPRSARSATAARSPRRRARRSASRASVAHTRRVAGQLPTGLDLARFGVPGDLLATADRMALVNLACTVEAFARRGPHARGAARPRPPGAGRQHAGRRDGRDGVAAAAAARPPARPSRARTTACRSRSATSSRPTPCRPTSAPTGRWSTRSARARRRRSRSRRRTTRSASGKALAVLAGGFDDLTPEGMVGFARHGRDRVAATTSRRWASRPHEASRANDVRRAGFVEAQGGGAQLVVRGDVALALGLPVRGVLAYAGSFADGLHASIPAAGMGALGRGATPLQAALERLGLTADDIAVVSKHDTSTEMNDPTEADLHERLQRRARPHARQPAARRLAEDGHRPRQGRRRGVAGRRRAADARERHGPGQPQPRERRPAGARARASDARRPPDPARRADQGGAGHLARLRPRLRGARDRAPRHASSPRSRRPRARTTCAAPAAAAPRARSSAWPHASAARRRSAARTAARARPGDRGAAAREAEAALLSRPRRCACARDGTFGSAP